MISNPPGRLAEDFLAGTPSRRLSCRDAWRETFLPGRLAGGQAGHQAGHQVGHQVGGLAQLGKLGCHFLLEFLCLLACNLCEVIAVASVDDAAR